MTNQDTNKRAVTPHCSLFALCGNDAEGAVPHPVLEWVPACRRCATKLGFDLVLAEWYEEA